MSPCASCGKKHPLNRSKQVARHFTQKARRFIGKMPAPPDPTPLPPPETPPEEKEEVKVEE